MHDAGIVDGGEPVGDGVDQRHDALRIRAAVAPLAVEARRQRAAVGVVHHEIRAAVVEATDVVHRHDVGRSDATEQARFLEEAQLHLLVVRQLLVQDLERDERLQFLVPGLDDDGESAAGYLPANLIATDVRG